MKHRIVAETYKSHSGEDITRYVVQFKFLGLFWLDARTYPNLDLAKELISRQNTKREIIWSDE